MWTKTLLVCFFAFSVLGSHVVVVVDGFAPQRSSPLTAPATTISTISTTSTALLQSASSIDDIDREELLEYLNSDAIGLTLEQYQRRERHKGYLENCLVFDQVDHSDLDRLADSMQEIAVPKGTVLMEKGSLGDAMYFVVQGQFDCFDNSTLLTSYQKPGEYFGELALVFQDQTRQATIVAARDGVVYQLDKTAFRTSLQESPVFDTARQMLLKKYSSTRLLQTLPRIQIWEIWALAKAMLQVPLAWTNNMVPSMFAFGMGASSTLLVTAWHMKVPSIESALPFRLVSAFLMASTLLGNISIPKVDNNTPTTTTTTTTTFWKDLVPRRLHQVGTVAMAVLWIRFLRNSSAIIYPKKLLYLKLQLALCMILETIRRYLANRTSTSL